jgi:hypothetical protein
MTLQIDILNPKATKLFKELKALNLISIRDQQRSELMKVVARIRKKASGDSPSMELITKEVEWVRSKRYAQKKR